MDELKDKKREYELLQKEIHEIKLNYNYNEGFSSKNDLDRFINENRTVLEHSNNLREQIKQLEWELMTPEERKHQEEIAEKIKKKRGKKPKN